VRHKNMDNALSVAPHGTGQFVDCYKFQVDEFSSAEQAKRYPPF